jgi:tryptophan-rich sensory protein
MHRDFSDFIIRNFVGAVGAWAVIYTLITLGQFLVYTIGVNKTFQAVCFFIAGILLIVGIALWNRHSYSTWGELIGFIGVGTLLLLFSAANTQRYSSGNGSSLLS